MKTHTHTHTHTHTQVTAVVTLLLGMGYAVSFLYSLFPLAFWMYSLHRAFLFTYFFTALPQVLGFKYFGILAGVAFLVAGVAQLGIKAVVDYGKGTCHLSDGGAGADCDSGKWGVVLTLHWLTLAACLSLPVVEHVAQRKEAMAREAVFGTPVLRSKRRTTAKKPLTPIRGGDKEEDEEEEDDEGLIF